jgi:hypothetical protein
LKGKRSNPHVARSRADCNSRLPLLLSYSLSDEGLLKHHQILAVAGNVLDVAVGPALWEIVVSIDTVHKPGSVKILRPEEVPQTEFFETFELSTTSSSVNGHASIDHRPEDDLRWEQSSLAILLNTNAAKADRGCLPSESAAKVKGNFSPAGDILYGLENLRKKRGQATEEAEDEGGADDEVAEPDS